VFFRLYHDASSSKTPVKNNVFDKYGKTKHEHSSTSSEKNSWKSDAKFENMADGKKTQL